MNVIQAFFKKAGSVGNRLIARMFAVVFLMSTIAYGTLQGGILDYEGSPLNGLSGKMASTRNRC